jgi:hypothetical protein
VRPPRNRVPGDNYRYDVSATTVSARLTKLCKNFKVSMIFFFFFFCTQVTTGAFLSISQNLKVPARLQGGTQTKHRTWWRDFELSKLFECFVGFVQGFAVLQEIVRRNIFFFKNKMGSSRNKLSNKPNLSPGNPVSCNIQIFKLTRKVL